MRTFVLALLAAALFFGAVAPTAKATSKMKPIHHRILAGCGGSGLDPDGQPCN